MTDSTNCRWAGGNDYVACMDCGVEFDYRKDPRPPCGGTKKREELIQQKYQIELKLERLRHV